MTSKSELLHFYDNYYNLIEKIEKESEFADKFYQSFLSGDNELYQKYISETKVFDEQWIQTVESYVPSINKIVQNPRSSIKTEEEIVAVERARRTSSQSIKHLASNTHLIKEIREDGSVMPKRVLTTYTDADYGTYENRFIMTLIDRLFIFVRSRYEIIKTNIESFEKRRFNLKSNFPVNETNVELELNFTLTDEIANKEINRFNQRLLQRVEYLNRIVTSFKSSQFMTMMKSFNKVYPPIMKTNVILKNVDFRNAYLLWLFIDRYNTLTFTTEVSEKNLTFDNNYYKAINRQVLMVYSAIIAHQEMNKTTYETIKPKKFTRKSIKIKRTHPDDIRLIPEDEVIEDQTLNEYYLNANKKIFKQSLDYHLEQVATYETGVKRALRETLNISNALYESFFELEEDDDVFRRLVKEIDVTKELTEARRKLLISKMIREVKAVDFNDALRREKKFLDEISRYDGLLLQEHKERLQKEKESIYDAEKIIKDRKEVELKRQIIDKQLAENKYLSEQMDNYRVEINKKINEYQKKLNEDFNAEVRKYRQEVQKINAEALSEYKKANFPTRRVTNQKLNQEKQKLNKDFSARKSIIEKEFNELLVKNKNLLKEQEAQKVQENKAKFQEMLAENQKNLEILKEQQKQLNIALANYQVELKTAQQKELKDYKEGLKKLTKERIAELRKEYKITNRITDYKLQQEIKKLADKLTKAKAELAELQKQEAATQKAKLAKEEALKVEKAEKELIKAAMESSKNEETLKRYRKKYRKEIKKLRERQ